MNPYNQHLQSPRPNNKSSSDAGRDGAEAVAGGDAVVGASTAAPQGVPAGQTHRQVMDTYTSSLRYNTAVFTTRGGRGFRGDGGYTCFFK